MKTIWPTAPPGPQPEITHIASNERQPRGTSQELCSDHDEDVANYPDPTERSDGVCIFLDGLSGRIHGNPETRDRDEQIRERLREMGYEVISIPATALTDRERMASYFFRLARCLMDRAAAELVRTNPTWFS